MGLVRMWKNLTSTGGEVVQEGFDYFFFDKSVIATYPPSAFCLGLPCWDYWAILAPLFSGIPVKKVITPHAYHIKHKVNWNNEISNQLFHIIYYCDILGHFLLRLLHPYYILEFIERYSRKITLYDENYDKETRQKLVPQIKEVIIKGEIQGRIIDKLLFFKMM